MASMLANLPACQPLPTASFRPPICSLTDLRQTNLVVFAIGGGHRSKMMRFFVVKSSNDDSSPSASPPSGSEATTSTATEPTVEAENPPAEAPKGQPSLISALNVEKALRGIAITDGDHYGKLGISRGCPYDQVPIAYKNKVEEIMKQQLEEEELNSQLEQLKESYRILSSVEERRLYDWSLVRSDRPDQYMWPFEVDITQTPTGMPPPREPEDVGPTRAVGYFLLGWLILGFTLSILLNR